jgi:hypothetical protein
MPRNRAVSEKSCRLPPAYDGRMAETKSTKSGFSAEERAAMKQRAAELKASQTREAGAKALADAIAAMTGLDKQLAEQIDEVISEAGPGLVKKTWYGFPAYTFDDKLIAFFKPAAKFKDRYATLGFDTAAMIDDGTMFPAAYAVLAPLTAAQQKTIADLIKKAVS